MINIAICDDEKPFRDKMEKMVALYMEQKGIEYTISTFGNGKELLEFCNEMEEQLVIFLDINMDQIDGIEIATKIRDFLSPDIYIVFVTAYVKYSVGSHRFNITRYLIKGDKNFDQLLEECIDAILKDLNYGVKKIEFDFKEGKKEFPVDNIIYIESNLHILNFHVCRSKRRKYTMTATLNEIEKMFEGCSFLRIHQSYLINLVHVKNIRAYIVELDDGSELPIPRTKYLAVKEAYVEYKGEI